jgi:hypothetical protein
VSDYLPESKNLARYACPTCEPDADPLSEILILDCCEYHKPDLAGLDDARVGAGPYLGNSETDLTTQVGMARLLR